MTELLLRERLRLEGPHRVEATVRPLRVVFLVPPSDPPTALAAVDACCLLWGGTLQFLVPCEPGSEPNPFWSEMLERHDPDEIIDTVGASHDFTERQERYMLRRVHRWLLPTETMLLRGVLSTSVLQKATERGTWQQNLIVRNVHPLYGHPLALPIAFAQGHLERRPMHQHDPLYSAYVGSRLENLVRIHTVNPRTLTDEHILRLLIDVRREPDTSESSSELEPPACKPIDLTSVFLAERSSIRTTQPPMAPREDQGNAGPFFQHQLVIVGSEDSVADLCLAWNLRAQRSWDAPFPLWLTPERIDSLMVRSQLETARLAGQERSRSSEWLGLLSASIDHPTLTSIASTLPRAVAHRQDDLNFIFPTAVSAGVERRSTAVFVRGEADVGLPDIDEIGRFDWQERLGVSVRVPGWQLPSMPKSEFGSSRDLTRATKDGLAGGLSPDRHPRSDSVGIKVPNGAEIVTAVAARAGYSAQISAPGRLAMAVFDLFGSPESLGLLASSKVYMLIREMAAIVSRQAVQDTLRRALPEPEADLAVNDVVALLQQQLSAGGQFDRPHFSWGKLQQRLDVPPKQAAWVIEFFVRRNILFRGYEIACPVCGLRRWHQVDQLAATHYCEGCQSSTPLPLPVDKSLVWHYRLNETVARAVDQGALAHLLVLRYLYSRSDRFEPNLLGALPGVEFTPLVSDSRTDRVPCEIDVFAIVEGSPVLAECKADGSSLTQRDVDKLVESATNFDASTVFLATPTSFAMAGEVVQDAERAKGELRLLVLESEDMLDPRDPWTQIRPEAKNYLKQTVDWLQQHEESF